MTGSADAAPAEGVKKKVGNYRWVVVALLFTALVINYVDRQHIGVLKPTHLQPEFGWSETDYANLVIWFQGAYAFAYLLWGRIIDRIGAKLGPRRRLHALDARAHRRTPARATPAIPDHGARGCSASAKPAAFPGGIKAVTEWFPKQERALATGIFNAGTNIGAIVTPLRRAVHRRRSGAGLARELLSSSAWRRSCGCRPGSCSTAIRARASTSRPPNWPSSSSDPPDPVAESVAWSACSRRRRPGPTRSANS